MEKSKLDEKQSHIETADYNPLINSENTTSSIAACQHGADFKVCDGDACSVNCGTRIELNSCNCTKRKVQPQIGYPHRRRQDHHCAGRL